MIKRLGGDVTLLRLGAYVARPRFSKQQGDDQKPAMPAIHPALAAYVTQHRDLLVAEIIGINKHRTQGYLTLPRLVKAANDALMAQHGNTLAAMPVARQQDILEDALQRQLQKEASQKDERYYKQRYLADPEETFQTFVQQHPILLLHVLNRLSTEQRQIYWQHQHQAKAETPIDNTAAWRAVRKIMTDEIHLLIADATYLAEVGILPPRTKEAWDLRQQGCSYTKIAASMGITKAGVHDLMNRAFRYLGITAVQILKSRRINEQYATPPKGSGISQALWDPLRPTYKQVYTLHYQKVPVRKIAQQIDVTEHRVYDCLYAARIALGIPVVRTVKSKQAAIDYASPPPGSGISQTLWDDLKRPAVKRAYTLDNQGVPHPEICQQMRITQKVLNNYLSFARTHLGIRTEQAIKTEQTAREYAHPPQDSGISQTLWDKVTEPSLKKAYTLHHQGLSNEEIGRRMGVTTESASQYIIQAKTRLGFSQKKVKVEQRQKEYPHPPSASQCGFPVSQQAWNHLKPMLKEAFYLDSQGIPRDEIAKRMGITLVLLASYIRTARYALRKYQRKREG